jgi:hypothetical protein
VAAVTTLAVTAGAAEIYIATNGNDANPGTLAQPLATVQAAQTNVRALIQAGLTEPVDVILRAGTYYLDNPLELRPEDSGTADFPITWRAATNETVVLSGGRAITNTWTTADGTNWVVDVHGVTNGWNFRQLIVNGTRATRARYPNADEANPFLYATGGGMDHVIINPAMVKVSWGAATDAQINMVPQSRFFNQWNTVTNVDTVAGRIDIADSERHRTIDSGSWFWIEGVQEEMDQPGEWFLDRAAGQLHYMPETGVDPNDLEIIAPYLNRIVNARGDVDAGTHVEHVHFKGLEFRHTTFSLGHIEARTHTDAAIMFESTTDSSVSNCHFENIGGYALWLHLDSQRNVFHHNTVLHSGGGGALLTGARFAYMDDTKIYTPGEAASKVAPILNEITHNTVEHCGRIRYYGGGVHLDSRPFSMSMAPGNLIAHNHFNDLSRNGIFAFRNQGGNVVEYNHIHDAMQTTVDGACIHFATMNHLNAPNYILNNWLYDIWGYEQKPNGTPVRHLANGVFLDWDTSNTTVKDNWVYNSGGQAFKYIWDNWNLVSSGNQSSSTVITPPFVAEVGPGGTATHGIDLANNKLIGSVIHYTDTDLVSTSGTWTVQSKTGLAGLFEFNFLRASGGTNEATYTLPITESGSYQISLLYSPDAANASDALVRIRHADGVSDVRWNMRSGSQHGFAVEIGEYNFETGQTATVTLSTEGATGYVVADSVAFVRTGSPVVITTPINGVLIDHDFTDGESGVGLNGRPADTLSIADGGPKKWTAGASFGADGDIAGGAKQTAFFDIGSAITKGNADSIFELEVVMQVTGSGSLWLSAGFFNNASPSTTADPTANGGVGWFLWRGDGEVEVRTGVGQDGKLGDGESVSIASAQTFTVRLDLSDWDGATNFGNLSVYHGTSFAGTLLYAGASPAEFNSGNGDFLAAGFSTSEQSGKINNFKLTQVTVARATGTLIYGR